ncbi:MAG: hypothetical protein PVH65_00005, partial [Chloroflexota bacterium]
MTKQHSFALSIVLLILILGLASCRREEPTATPETQAAPSTATAEPEEQAAAKPTVRPSPTAIPAVEFDYDWAPQVVYSSPAPGEELVLDGAITI